MPTALEISRRASPKPVSEIAAEIGLPPWLTEPYGEHVAKIDLGAIEALADRPRARHVVVTAVTPAPLGEGKTTTTVGLGQAMRHIGKRATIAIRQARAPAGAGFHNRGKSSVIIAERPPGSSNAHDMERSISYFGNHIRQILGWCRYHRRYLSIMVPSPFAAGPRKIKLRMFIICGHVAAVRASAGARAGGGSSRWAGAAAGCCPRSGRPPSPRSSSLAHRCCRW